LHKKRTTESLGRKTGAGTTGTQEHRAGTIENEEHGTGTTETLEHEAGIA